MDTTAYKEKFFSSNPLTIDLILEMFNQTEWYFLETKEKELIYSQILSYLKINLDILTKEQIETIFNKCYFTDINDAELSIKIMNKSLEIEIPLVSTYDSYFNQFNNETLISYIKLLNKHNSDDFNFLKYRITDKENTHVKNFGLYNIYYEHFFSATEEVTSEKTIPCDHFNKFFISQNLVSFFQNKLLSKTYKTNFYQKYFNDDTSSSHLYEILRTINSHSEIQKEYELIPFVINKLISDPNILQNKSNLIDFISSLNSPDKISDACKFILSNENTKNSFIHILKSKIKPDNNNGIKNFKYPISDNVTNLNFLQYLVFNKNNSFVVELCNKDKDFFNLFNKPLHQTVSNFDYEKSPLDLVLSEFIVPEFVSHIYMNKLINREIKPLMQDKVCAVLFMALRRSYIYSQSINSINILNALTLIPHGILNKHIKRSTGIFNEKNLNEIIKIKDMVELKSKLPEKLDSKVVKKFKV